MVEKLCDSHVEFIHAREDFSEEEVLFSSSQINPTQINQIKPDLLFLAVWIAPTRNAWSNMLDVIDNYLKEIIKNNWLLVKNKSDLNKKGIKIILHIEDLFAIDNDLTKIDKLYELGIRSIGLTHNPANQFAGGSLSEKNLTSLGKKTISKILNLGIILDMAHLNTKSFDSVLNNFDIRPFVSHAGIYGCFPNPRNVQDSVLQQIKEKDGYIGIGFAGSFLAKEKASINDIKKQINYAAKIAGPSRVGIGSDLGGISSYLPADLTRFAEIKNLKVSKEIAGSNLINFVKSILK